MSNNNPETPEQEIARLEAEIEAASGWGAAVGVKDERVRKLKQNLAGPLDEKALDAEFLATARRTVEQYNEARKKRADPYGIAIDCRDELAEMVEPLLDALNSTSSAAPAGWKLVPVEPTITMQNAGWREIDRQGFSTDDTEVAPIYRAMLAASPSTPDAAPVVRGLEWKGEEDDHVLVVAKAIAEEGFGRPWDDFLPINAFDTDQADLKDYARAAVAAFRSALHPIAGTAALDALQRGTAYIEMYGPQKLAEEMRAEIAALSPAEGKEQSRG